MNIRHKGFSLIEVMVSVAILSFGLLSIAALQINAKKSSYDSVQRSIATQLAQDIIEKMRANADNLAGYQGSTVGGNTLNIGGINCSTGTCSGGEIASYDLKLWENSMDSAGGGLQSPTACITGPASAGDSGLYTITLVWRGVERMKDVSANNCGAGNYGNNDEFRRILTVTTFISTSGFGV